MYQSSWPGFPARTVDPIALPIDEPGGGTRTISPIANGSASDGISTPWYAQSSQPGFSPGAFGSYGGLGGYGGGIGGLLSGLQSLLGMLQQSIASALQGFGTQSSGGGTTTRQPWSGGTDPRTVLRDADLSSTGDPHLAETGTDANGNAISKHLDSMTAHGDLIDAQIAGGYRISTQVTAPQANGVTYNKSVSVTMDGGSDSVSMDGSGAVSITENGMAMSIAKGQSLALGRGDMVTENADGSVIITATNGNGGSIATTLRTNGSGVDVTAHVHDIAVGGDIVNS
jgi:hypothetical protein